MESNAILCWYPHVLSDRLHSIVNGLYLQSKTDRPVYTYWQLNEYIRIPTQQLFDCPLPQLTPQQFDEYLPLCTARSEDVCVKGTGLMDWVNTNPGRLVLCQALVEGDISSEFIRATLRGLKWNPTIISQFRLEKDLYRI